jgi:hypothetical protein
MDCGLIAKRPERARSASFLSPIRRPRNTYDVATLAGLFWCTNRIKESTKVQSAHSLACFCTGPRAVHAARDLPTARGAAASSRRSKAPSANARPRFLPSPAVPGRVTGSRPPAHLPPGSGRGFLDVPVPNHEVIYDGRSSVVAVKHGSHAINHVRELSGIWSRRTNGTKKSEPVSRSRGRIWSCMVREIF